MRFASAICAAMSGATFKGSCEIIILFRLANMIHCVARPLFDFFELEVIARTDGRNESVEAAHNHKPEVATWMQTAKRL